MGVPAVSIRVPLVPGWNRLQRLEAVGVLPGIAHRGLLDRDVRRFIAGRADPELPPHRQLDMARARLKVSNRAGDISLVMSVQGQEWAYASKRLLGVLNDLFAYLQRNHIDYLHREFGLPEE